MYIQLNCLNDDLPDRKIQSKVIEKIDAKSDKTPNPFSFNDIKTVNSSCKLSHNQSKEMLKLLRKQNKQLVEPGARQRFLVEKEGLKNNMFKLKLVTSAGTYVKEFVHGDFNRTKPNLCTLLNCDTDILALDVEEVELEWPPKKYSP